MTEEEQAKAEEEEGDEPKVESPLEESRRLVAEMKEQNQLLQKNLAQLSELKATEMLSGTANAGQVPEKNKEMSDEEYAQRVMAGEVPDVPKKE